MNVKHRLRTLSPRAKHHMLISLAVGMATLSHYAFEWLAPSLVGLSPLAGFAASLVWIWKD